MIASFANLVTTNSQTLTLTEPFHEADPAWWNAFVQKIAEATNGANIANRELMHPNIPTFYLRYEDLVIDPEPALTDLFCFLLDVESISGTIVEKRIADYVANSTKKTVYKLKADPKTGILRNKHLFSDAQLEMMKEKCRDFLYYFNYTDSPNGESDPNTTYFAYDGET